MEAKIEQTTRQRIDELNRNVQTNKERAMQILLRLVCDIQPELHQNYQVLLFTAAELHAPVVLYI